MSAEFRLPRRILLVGCGRMGKALLDGLTLAGCADVVVVDPALSVLDRQVHSSVEDVVRPWPDAVVLAVKASALKSLGPSFARRLTPGALIISMMAGVTARTLQHVLGDEASIVRGMPNLAASVLEGVTALYASAPVPKARRLEAQYMMETIGRVAWVESESQLDAVTAVASSGLAYFFELADALALAARQAGLGGEFSDWLAQQTLRGAGAMMREGGPSPRQLSDAVCSPGGTTAAALGELQPDLAHAVSRAVSAARSKAVALSSA